MRPYRALIRRRWDRWRRGSRRIARLHTGGPWLDTPQPDPDPVPPGAEVARAELVELVLERTESPIDVWAVAATLESEGVRDVDARERFGRQDVFGLAQQVYDEARARLALDPPQRPVEEPERLRTRALRGAGFYVRGMFFALPLTLQLVALLTLGYGMWVWLKFSEAQITMVAVASVLSFVATDGFVQAAGRLGSQYVDQEKHILARRVVLVLLARGFIAASAIGVLGALPFFGDKWVRLGLIYYVLMCGLWMATALLYVVKQLWAILLSTAAGLGAVAVMFEFLHTSIYAAQWAGLGVAIVASLAWGLAVLGSRARSVKGAMRLAGLPRRALLRRAVAPYFLYGILYYSFLFFDRMLAWTAPGRADPSLVISFSTPYELGLDWALISLVPCLAVLEYSVRQLSWVIIPAQERFGGLQMRAHNRWMFRFYLRQVGLVLLLALIGGLGVNAIMEWLHQNYDTGYVRDFFSSRDTLDVHVWGSVGYALVTVGLLNSLFIVSLARPWRVIAAFAAATATTGVGGYFLSREGEYWWSVIGMTAGGLVFAVLTTILAVPLLRRADYHFYAAY